jgi:hypothetical protein
MKNMSSLKHAHREHFSKVLVKCRTEPAHRSRTCLANPLWNAGKEINSCETRNAQTLRSKIISPGFQFDTWKRTLHLGLFSSVMWMGFKRMEEWPEANQPSRQHCRCSVYLFFMCIAPGAGCSSWCRVFFIVQSAGGCNVCPMNIITPLLELWKSQSPYMTNTTSVGVGDMSL